MSLSSGDLTTPQRVANWMASPPNLPNAAISQIITSMSKSVLSKLSRSSFLSQTFTRTADGVGNYQLVLPDYPVTGITSVQMGAVSLQLYPLPNPVTQVNNISFGYGYRFIPWAGNLPGEPCVLEFVNGAFCAGVQNIKVVYTAGYLISNEAQTVPSSGGAVTATQPNGICAKDAGVTYAVSGVALTPVASAPGLGQYIPPQDSNPGVYTFSSADANAAVLLNYSFIPADVEDAVIQLVVERLVYRTRIGIISQSLGGQESVRFLRGGGGRGYDPLADVPPEVRSLLSPYVNVVPPWLGAPI